MAGSVEDAKDSIEMSAMEQRFANGRIELAIEKLSDRLDSLVDLVARAADSED